MAIRPDYTIGTITLTSGSKDFTTVGSSLESAAVTGGDTIMTADGLVLIIDEITGQNSGTLLNESPVTVVDEPLVIRFQPDGSKYQGAARDLIGRWGQSGNVDAFAGLAGVVDGVPVFTGAGTMEVQGKDTFVTPDPNGNLAELAGLSDVDNLAELASISKTSNQFIVMGKDGGLGIKPIDSFSISDVKDLSLFSSSNPIFIAHRNQAQLYPDQSLGSFRMSAKSPYVDALEMDCRVLSDGGVVVFHDATVDRVTTSTGNVESLTTEQFKELRIDGEVWQGSNTVDGSKVVTVDEVLKEFKGKKLFMPEIKTAGKGQQVVDVFVANDINKSHAVFSSFRLADLLPAKTAGYQTMFATSTATPTEISDAVAAGVDWVALNKSAADTDVAAWIAAGIKVISWSVNRRFDRDRLLALGVTGFYSDDVEYIARNEPVMTTLELSSGNWLPGMLAASDRMTDNWRGRIFPDGSWGWPVKQDDSNTTRQFVLQGWASKLPIGESSVTVRARFIDSDNNARWFSIAMSQDDRELLDDSGDTWTNGYSALVNQDGNLRVYKLVNGVATNITTTSVPVGDRIEVPNGGECIVRLSFTGTTVSLSRLSANGSVLYSVNAVDGAYRGGYLQIGRRHVAASFKDIQVRAGNTVLPLFSGEIIQSGINANGNFVRYADGTQICSNIIEIAAPTEDIIGGSPSWVYPASFVGGVTVFASIALNSGQTDGRVAANFKTAIRSEGVNSAGIDWFYDRKVGGASGALPRLLVEARGRWF